MGLAWAGRPSDAHTTANPHRSINAELACINSITAASEQTPYLSIVLKLDLSMLNEVIQTQAPLK